MKYLKISINYNLFKITTVLPTNQKNLCKTLKRVLIRDVEPKCVVQFKTIKDIKTFSFL